MPLYFGGETKKALHNFPFDVRRVHPDFIKAMLVIKEAGAIANKQSKNITPAVSAAIVAACKQLRAALPPEQFPVPFLNGGAGTSMHMNVNEVVANLATDLLKRKKQKIAVHPNDDVNRGMSTNDVIPTALRLAAYPRVTELLKELHGLEATLGRKAVQFKNIRKLARTHLQDAVPTTLGAEFGAFKGVVNRHKATLLYAQKVLLDANLGGSAIGNCVNATPVYRRVVYKELRRLTGIPLRPAKNLMSATSSATDFLVLAQALVALSADLSKIANDLRLLSSGPLGGLGEIKLPEMQKGSSIMPGKVNPVIAELMSQIYFMLSGNCHTTELAAQAGQLQLNVMLPVVVDRILESFDALTPMVMILNKFCVAGIVPNGNRATKILEQSFAFATSLTPALGYDVVSKAVKDSLANGLSLRETLIKNNIVSGPQLSKLLTSLAK